MQRLQLRPAKAQATRRQTLPAPGTEVIIGVDLARTKWVYVCRWAGEEQRRLSTPGTLEHLQALVQEYLQRGCRVTVVYEACGFGYAMAWWVSAQRGATVLVVAPSTVERAPGAQVKTDRLDAGGLALRAARGQLRSIFVPPPLLQQHRQLSRTYGQAVRARRRAQAQVRLCFQAHGYTAVPERTAGWGPLAAWTTAQLPQLPAPLAASVAELLDLRAAGEASARRLQRLLRQLATTAPYAPVVRALTQQPGVGPLTAIRVVLELGDRRRFRSGGALVNYLGLTPSEYSTGETVRRGRTRKCGPGAVRAWLVQCAWVAIRPGRDAHLRTIFERLAPRIGRKRAIVAVARRLVLQLRARWLAADKEVPAT